MPTVAGVQSKEGRNISPTFRSGIINTRVQSTDIIIIIGLLGRVLGG